MEIITIPNNILRTKAKKIRKVDNDIKKIIADMTKMLRSHNGVGLAAPQINIPLRLLIIEAKKNESTPKIPLTVLINPEIVEFSDKKNVREEGCLSVPDVWGEVERFSNLTVRALNGEGKKIKIKATGLFARIIQHEVDHLNGILFTDKARLETLHQISPEGTKIKLEGPIL